MHDEDHRFILDSGATLHATGNLHLFSALELASYDDHSARAPASTVFRRRDGKVLPVAGTGTVAVFARNFSFAGVRYVPDLGRDVTLVSVQQLAASGLLVMFCGDFCCIRDVGNGGAVIGEGRLHDKDGFYHLEFLMVPELPLGYEDQDCLDGMAA
jgi:hypothetical protein